MSTAPDFLVAAARQHRRRQRSAAAASWVTEASAPISWSDDATLLRAAEQLNQPYHRQLQRFGEIGPDDW
jgi:hypothetical protein